MKQNTAVVSSAATDATSCAHEVWVVEAVLVNLDDEETYSEGGWFVESVWATEDAALVRASAIFTREEYHCVPGAFCGPVNRSVAGSTASLDAGSYGQYAWPRPAASVRRMSVQ